MAFAAGKAPRKQLATKRAPRPRAFKVGDWVRVSGDGECGVGRVEDKLSKHELVVQMLESDQYACEGDEEEPVPCFDEDPRGDRVTFFDGRAGGTFLIHYKA